MSERGRLVLAAIDVAVEARGRHPRLFAAHLARGHDASQLARAYARYKIERPEPSSHRPDRDEVERVDPGWEETEAQRRQARFEKRKPGLDADRRSRRMAMDAHELYRLAVERAGRLSTVPAGNIAAGRGGESAGVPRQQLLEDDPRWRRRWGIVKNGLLLAHDLLDECEGHGIRPDRDATSEDLHRLVLVEGRGMSCKEAAARFPEATGGHAAFVRQLRDAQGTGLRGLDLLGYRVSRGDGEPLASASGPGVRRVRIAQ